MKIDINVPIPPRRQPRTDQAMSMPVGSSAHIDTRSEAEAIRHALKRSNCDAVVRREGAGYRVWRVA